MPEISASAAVEPVREPLKTFETHQVKHFSNKKNIFYFYAVKLLQYLSTKRVPL